MPTAESYAQPHLNLFSTSNTIACVILQGELRYKGAHAVLKVRDVRGVKIHFQNMQ